MGLINNGRRQLRLEARFPGTFNPTDPAQSYSQSVTKVLRRIVLTQDRMIRDDILGQVAGRVIEEARSNIQEGQSTSNYPQSGRLAKSLKILPGDGDTLTISAGEGLVNDRGEKVNYAIVHNKPIGSFTTIYPKKSAKLNFRWYKIGMAVSLDRVRRPGTAFLDRAADKAKAEIPNIARNTIRRYQNDTYEDIYVIGRGGAKVQRFGSLGLKGAEALGFVQMRTSATGRRDRVMTETGKQYVRASARGRKKMLAQLRKERGL